MRADRTQARIDTEPGDPTGAIRERTLEALEGFVRLSTAGVNKAGEYGPTTLVWVSWTMPLFFAEVAIQWKRSIGSPEARRGKARPVHAS